jgi:hypothetical protein
MIVPLTTHSQKWLPARAPKSQSVPANPMTATSFEHDVSSLMRTELTLVVVPITMSAVIVRLPLNVIDAGLIKQLAFAGTPEQVRTTDRYKRRLH